MCLGGKNGISRPKKTVQYISTALYCNKDSVETARMRELIWSSFEAHAILKEMLCLI